MPTPEFSCIFCHLELAERSSESDINSFTMMKMKRHPAVYILTNHTNTVLYIGVTSNPIKRVWEHKQKFVEGFTSNYHLYKLIYYEILDSMENAIQREKQLKRWSRKKKESLIERLNPEWMDLYDEIASGW